MTAERHMVVIETEGTGKIEMTPEQFDMLLMAASVALDGDPFEGDPAMSDLADDVWEIVMRARRWIDLSRAA